MDKADSLDQLDLLIIRHLQEDASITNADLAKKVSLSPSACLGRSKRLKETGVLERFTAVVNKKKLGYNVQAFLFLSLAPHNRQTTEKFLSIIDEMPGIMECYNISGKFDFLLKVIASDLEDYRNFVIDELLEVPGVNHVESQVVLKEIKNSYAVPLDTMIDNKEKSKKRG